LKTIIAIRHAKSSWAEPNLTDQQRPLNKRGHGDAPRMAKYLESFEAKIDSFYSSPAKRAFTTACYFADHFGIAQKDIQIEHDLYFGEESDMLDLIQRQDDDLKSMIFFSHNPTITNFINQFSQTYISNIPTCGISVLKSEVESWENVNEDSMKLVNSFYPKLI